MKNVSLRKTTVQMKIDDIDVGDGNKETSKKLLKTLSSLNRPVPESELR